VWKEKYKKEKAKLEMEVTGLKADVKRLESSLAEMTSQQADERDAVSDDDAALPPSSAPAFAAPPSDMLPPPPMPGVLPPPMPKESGSTGGAAAAAAAAANPLLASIQAGKALRKTEAPAPRAPVDDGDEGNVLNMIAKALLDRRAAIKDDNPNKDGDGDGEWDDDLNW